MKLKNLLFLLLSAMILTTSCSKDDDDDNGGVTLTGIALDKATMSVAVGSTGTLTATLAPTGATGTVNWSSDKPAIATVTNGVVTGVAEGTATITASVGSFSATCAVTITKTGVDPNPNPNAAASLKGSDYYLFFLDATSFAKIPSAKIKQDLRPDEATAVMDIWPGGDSYTAATTSGPNFYGEVEGWIALTANAAPWQGTGAGGIRQIKNFDLTGVDGTYTFHCAYKSQDGGAHELCLFKADGGETWFNIPTSTDGEWHELEIPMSQLISKGWSFTRPYVLAGDGQNALGFRTTGAGKTLQVDAVFIYKK